MDWTKIYIAEDEFLEVEQSVESTVESEEEESEPETVTSKGRELQFAKSKSRVGKSFSVGRLGSTAAQKSALFALSQVDEGNESFDELVEKDKQYFDDENDQEGLPRLKKGNESRFIRTSTLDPRQKRA